MVKLEDLLKYLSDFNKTDVEIYYNHYVYLYNETKDWKRKNLWTDKLTEKRLADYFKKNEKTWLKFDWIHIILSSTWISYDYVAYKKAMYNAYPETTFDASIVYKWDNFVFKKEDWKVFYSHELWNPFEKKETEIIWAYAVVKNRRWEFIVTLSPDEIKKHRQVAKTDYIWKAWLSEMILKTVSKKISKQFFWDEFQAIEENDNENYNLEKVNIDIETELFEKIQVINTVEELKAFYLANKGKWKDFDKAVMTRKLELTKKQNENS